MADVLANTKQMVKKEDSETQSTSLTNKTKQYVDVVCACPVNVRGHTMPWPIYSERVDATEKIA